jgi:hypothetical protein
MNYYKMLMCFLMRLLEYIDDEPVRLILLERYTQLINVPAFKESIHKDLWQIVDNHFFMAHLLTLSNVSSDTIKIEIDYAKLALQKYILSCKLVELRVQKGGCLGDLDVLPFDCMRYISDYLP